jgi:hypothetical protein
MDEIIRLTLDFCQNSDIIQAASSKQQAASSKQQAAIAIPF